MASAIVLLAISLAAIVAGRGYVATARRMRTFRTTRGTVLAKEIIATPGDSRDAHWGKGGGHQPKITYAYTVEGVTHTSDRYAYAIRGYNRDVVAEQLAATPDELDVHYDPADPEVAYLHRHNPRIGYALVAGGAFGTIAGLIALLAAAF